MTPTYETAPVMDIEQESFATGPRGVVYYGTDERQWFGSTVSGAGDFNGDGVGDYVVGSITAHFNNRVDCGVLYMVFGRNGSEPPTDLIGGLAPDQGFMIAGDEDCAEVGASMAGVGDLNGDGYDDFAVGASTSSPPGLQWAGIVYVLLGHNASLPYGTVDLALGSAPGRVTRIFGAHRTDYLGSSVAAAGDVNGDGRADIVLGAPNENAGAGVVYVLFGRSDWADIHLDTLTSNDARGFRLVNPAATGLCGASVAGAGDVNGDGDADIVFGCPQQGTNACGLAYVVFGSPTRDLHTVHLDTMTPSEGYLIINPSAVNDQLGSSVASAGDFNGDGIDDLVISAKLGNGGAGVFHVLFGPTRAQGSFQVPSGPLQAADGFRILPAHANGLEYNYAARAAGDVNGDGYGDLVVGVPWTASSTASECIGDAYVLYGHDGGSVPYGDVYLASFVASSVRGYAVHSTFSTSCMGYAVSGAGDVDGDGLSDVLIGAQFMPNPDSSEFGGAYLLYGVTPRSLAARMHSKAPSGSPTVSPTRQPTIAVTAAPSTVLGYGIPNIDMSTFTSGDGGYKLLGGHNNDRTGAYVGAVGDVNHDGKQDFAVAAPGRTYESGIIYVIYGQGATIAADFDLGNFTSGAKGFLIIGFPTGDSLSVVKGLGDVNGDHIDDFAIAATAGGYMYVIYGSSNQRGTISLNDLDSGAGFPVYIPPGYELGWAVAAAGDINLDGKADLLIGCPGVSAYDGGPVGGAAFVVLGAPWHADVSLEADYPGLALGFAILGETLPGRLGTSVSGAGDVNGDFADDIIVGDSSGDFNFATVGTAYVIFGPVRTTADVYVSALGGQSWGYRILGTASSQFGYSVGAAGDFNGDGIDDLMVGAPSASVISGRPQSGAVYVIFGSGDTGPRADVMTSAFEAAGFTGGFRVIPVPENATDSEYALVAAGDVNHDGRGDIAIGFPDYGAGAVYVLFGRGPDAAYPDIDLGSFHPSSNLGYAIVYPPGTDSMLFGCAVSSLGDLNADGYADLLIGAPLASFNIMEEPGYAVVIYGSAPKTLAPTPSLTMAPTRTPTSRPSSAAVHALSKRPGELDVDLATFAAGPRGFSVIGAAQYDWTGTAVSPAGDVNGDNISDFMASAPGNIGGVVVIIYGRNESTVRPDLDLLGLTSSPSVSVLSGEEQGDSLGSSLAALGDVNGDGVDDIGLGAEAAALPFLPSAGCVYVVYGKRGGGLDSVDLPRLAVRSEGYRISGGHAFDQAGSVAAAGDVNGDGRPDILVGAKRQSINLNAHEGVAYVIFSKAGPAVDIDLAAFVTSNTMGFRVLGSQTSEWFGTSLSSAGDFNHDGFDDLLFGSPTYASSASFCGVAYVLYGHTAAQRAFSDVTPAISLDPLESGFRILGDPQWDDQVGSAVAAAGDVNGDGVDDIIVGASGVTVHGREQTGAVCVLFGRQDVTQHILLQSFVSGPATGFRIFGAAEFDYFGGSVGLAGDVNGDGYADLIAGAGNADVPGLGRAGTIYVVYLPLPAQDIFLSAFNSSMGFKLIGAHESDGLSVGCGVGDVNGDGLGDIAVGAPAALVPGRDRPGAAYLINGFMVDHPVLTNAPSVLPSAVPTAAPSPLPTKQPTASTGTSAPPSAAPSVGLVPSIDLDGFSPGDHRPVFRAIGSEGDALFGRTVASAGDFNGDGVEDIMFGEPFYGADDRGRVYLLLGTRNMRFADFDAATFESGPHGLILEGAEWQEEVGSSLAGLGDVNGDELDDIAIGAPGGTSPTTGDGAGGVYVIYGHRGPYTLLLLNAITGLGFRITGASTGVGLGSAVAAAGDVNGDGRMDLLLGSSNEELPGRGAAGAAYIIFGQTSDSDFSLNDFSGGDFGYKVVGDVDNELGTAVAGLGDINGDGYADVAIAASNRMNGTTSTGAVYILYGGDTVRDTSGYIDLQTPPPPGILFAIFGRPEDVNLGGAVSGAGDFNGDGFDDILIGAMYAASTGISNVSTSNGIDGAAFMIYGQVAPHVTDVIDGFVLGTGLGFAITAQQINDQLGYAVAGGGDVNGDDYDDIVVAASQQQYMTGPGTVYVVFGRGAVPGVVALIGFAAPNLQGYLILGDMVTYPPAFGSSLALCDFNDDGTADILVGAEYYSPANWTLGVAPPGGAFLLYGQHQGPSRAPTPAPTVFREEVQLDYFVSGVEGTQLTGPASHAWLGTAMDLRGDFNGDGINDLVISAPGASSDYVQHAGVVYIIPGRSDPTDPFQTVDLANFLSGMDGVRIFGAQPFNEIGGSIAYVGDTNGDGYDDVAIGLPSYSPPSGDILVGAVYVLWGTTDKLDVDLGAFAAGTQGFVVFGANATDGLGTSVAAAGDINSDGYDDVLASLEPAAVPGVCVIFGKPTLTTVHLRHVSGNDWGFRITNGDNTMWMFAAAIAGAGDVNGDGHPDLVIGAPADAYGAAIVIFGHSNATAFTDVAVDASPLPSNVLFLMGSENGQYVGQTVGSAGDYNGDGTGDLLVTTPNYLVGPTDADVYPVAYVLIGPITAAAHSSLGVFDSNSTHGFRVVSVPVSDTQPIFATGAGDVNSDGFDDLLVTTFMAKANFTDGVGAVFVLYGHAAPYNDIFLSTFVSGSARGYKIVGQTVPNGNLGTSSTAGDFNGDGTPDIVAGSPLRDVNGRNEAGTVFLVLGSAPHPPTAAPTVAPTSAPTVVPSTAPTFSPTEIPSHSPSLRPTLAPTVLLSVSPTAGPTVLPTALPCADPTALPAAAPTAVPGAAVPPTSAPTRLPTLLPTSNAGAGAPPTAAPSVGLVSSIDLDNFDPGEHRPIFRAIGSEPGVLFGQSIASAGDFNGDGVEDIMFGEPFYGADDRGRVYLLLGTRNMRFADFDAATFESGPHGLILEGTDYLEHVGASLAGLGDVNGDGLDDIAIGAPGGSSPTRTGSGGVYVIYGHRGPYTSLLLNDIPGRGFRITGASAGDGLGSAVAAAGDVNGDGRMDILLGSSKEVKLGRGAAGAAYIIFGQTTYSDFSLNDFMGGNFGGYKVVGEVANAIGTAVAGLGDINGDGYADVGIAASGLSDGSATTGAVFVLYGGDTVRDTSGYIDLQSSLPEIWFAILGRTEDVNLGGAVSGAGDFNGDGFDDILIGAMRAVSITGNNDGAAFLIYGQGTPLVSDTIDDFTQSIGVGFAITPQQINDQLGCAVAGGGDVNGDDYDDIVVSALQLQYGTGPGTVYVIFGRSAVPGVIALNGFAAPNPQGYLILGDASTAYRGFANSLVLCDFNDDGTADILAGAASYAPAWWQDAAPGGAFLLYGQHQGPSRAPTPAPTAFSEEVQLDYFVSGAAGTQLMGPAAQARLGTAMDLRGDFNGDGINDLVISAPGANSDQVDHAGVVYIIPGRSDSTTPLDTIDLANFLPLTDGMRIFGGELNSEIGKSIAYVGDTNGDGYDDIAIGQPEYSLPSGNPFVGIVFVVWGTASKFDLDLISFAAGLHGFVIFGASTGDALGAVVAAAGDINGDGFDDVLTAMNFAVMPRVYVVFGYPRLSSVDLGDVTGNNWGFRITIGDNTAWQFGFSLASAGDVNGDHYADLIIGAPNYSGYGAAVVIFGHSNVTAFTNIALDANPLSPSVLFLFGSQSGNSAGQTVDSAGDYNGDGTGDLLVTSPACEIGTSVLPIVYVLLGPITAADHQDLDAFGTDHTHGFRVVGLTGSTDQPLSATGAGDVNSDGFDDLLVSAYTARANFTDGVGTVFVLYGHAAPYHDIYLSMFLSGSATGYMIVGQTVMNGYLGMSYTAGDFNGDRAPDIVAGSPYREANGKSEAGTAFLLLGDAPPPPTTAPNVEPTLAPTLLPSTAPTTAPTDLPSVRPTLCPSSAPTLVPSVDPTAAPSAVPSVAPTANPTAVPSVVPTTDPTAAPTQHPSVNPSVVPTVGPSVTPSAVPTAPSTAPSTQPNVAPTAGPTRTPTVYPTKTPSYEPSVPPTPTAEPSATPTTAPSESPTVSPSQAPTTGPTSPPSAVPTATATTVPTEASSVVPTQRPTAAPTPGPSVAPTSALPADPSTAPTVQPTAASTDVPVAAPTAASSVDPSTAPTAGPTTDPTLLPFVTPSTAPTTVPSVDPTVAPTGPTADPSASPTTAPSADPTVAPTLAPSSAPTLAPLCEPSAAPSTVPTTAPTVSPSAAPSAVPTFGPSVRPTAGPTAPPSAGPSVHPSVVPTASPSLPPSVMPSLAPTMLPTVSPTIGASQGPTCLPTLRPSSAPVPAPTAAPSRVPTVAPSAAPSHRPTAAPTVNGQTVKPTASPTTVPTPSPFMRPTLAPTITPSTWPTIMPTNFEPYYTNATISQVTASKTTLSFTVTTAGRDAAFLYCAAFATTPALGALLSAVRAQANVQYADPHDTLSFELTHLVPATAYTVFCTAVTTLGTEQPASVVMQAGVALRTDCCRQVYVSLLTASAVAGTMTQSALAVSLEAPPTIPLTVRFSFAFANTTGTTAASAYPTELRFSNASQTGRLSYVALVAGTPGAQQLTVTLSSAAQSQEHAVQYLTSRFLTVKSSRGVPAVPTPLSAVFSADGASVTVTFDSATDKGGYQNVFPCSRLLVFAGSTAASCQWSDASHIVVYPRYSAAASAQVLTVGGNVTVGSAVRAQCTSLDLPADCAAWQPASAVPLPVAAPTTPTAPMVRLSAPATVGGCGSLTLDLTNSVGAAGRPWSRPQWRVSAGDNPAAAQQLQSYLSQNYTLSPPTVVPNSAFAKGLTYTVQASMCNFLGACGSAVTTVIVLSSQDALPAVTILGASQRTMYRTTFLSLNGDAYTQDCSGAKACSGLQYSWDVRVRTAADGVYADSPLISTSQSQTVFKLPAYTLAVGSQYEVTLSVRSTASGLSATARSEVTVLPSSLVAKIAGGSSRFVAVGDTMTIDASGSYDEDQPTRTGLAALLTFSWECVQLAPTFSLTCPLTMPASTAQLDKVNLVAPELSLNTTAQVTVTVSDGYRSSSAQVVVTATQAPTPKLTIASAVQSLSNVNTASQLVLYGTVEAAAACTAVWSVDDPSLSLSDLSRTATSKSIAPAAGPTAFNLALVGGSLPARATLVFSLSCDRTATSVTVTTNGSPLPGSFTVSPTAGTELSTVFVFYAEQWNDPDLPLTYQFGFESVTSLANLVIVSKSEFSYASSTLPAGREEDSYQVQASLLVFDSLNAGTAEHTAVTVTPVPAADKDGALLALLRSNSGSVDSAKNLISVVSTAINSVNCTGVAKCPLLHRAGCLKTSGECGSCLPGYIGDAGDRSTLCIPAVAALRNTSSVTCVGPGDCLSWQVCGTESGVCEAPSKSCSRNCTDNGRCLFVNEVSGAVQPTCKLDDLGCEAVCSCQQGFSGAFCELGADLLQSKRAVRSNLIDSLLNLTGIEDINAQSVSAWSASLYSLSIRPYELSVNDVKKVAAIANTTLRNAISLGVDSYEDIAGVLQATDTAASLLRYNYNPNDYTDANFDVSREFENNTAAAIVQTVSTFGDLVRRSMVLGQNRTALVYDNFRLSVDLSAMSASAGNVTLTSPQSDFELLQLAAPTTVTLSPSDHLLQAATVAVKLVAVYPRAYSPDTTAFVSNPLSVQVQAQAADGAAASPYDVLSTLDFTFQNNEAQVRFLRDPAVNYTSACAVTDHPQRTFSFSCPGSGHVISHNCSRGAGTQVSYCPRPAPSCAQLDKDTAVATVAQSCRVTAYNATYTTCSCSLAGAEDSTGHRLQNLRGSDHSGEARSLEASTAESRLLDDTGATDVMASTVFIASDFAETFSAAGSFTSPKDALRVIVVIVMLGAMWVPGLLVIVLEKSVGKQAKVTLAQNALQDARQKVLRYVNNAIPRVFTEQGPLWQRVWAEVQEHHVFFRLFTKANLVRRRETICKSLTIFTFMLFLVAAFFDVSSPGNDGSCVGQHTQSSCLRRTSPFDSKQAYCKWEEVDHTSMPSCSYQQQHMTMTALFYLTVLTTVLTAIATVPLDYCFGIISAPTAKSLQGSKLMNAVQAVALGARRFSNAGAALGRRMSDIAGRATSGTGNRDDSNGWSLTGVWRALTGEVVMASREVPEEVMAANETAREAMQTVASNAQALALRQGLLERRHKTKSARLQQGSPTKHVGSNLSKSEDLRAASHAGSDRSEDSGNSCGTCAALLADIVQQRLLMNDAAEESQRYDAQWGVLHVACTPPLRDYRVRLEAQECIAEEVQFAAEEAKRLASILPNYSVHHAGLEVLHLFMVDLLGRRTPAARIYQEKFGEEFEHSKVVVLLQKYAAVIALVTLNMFFGYYIMLKALQKGYAWQIRYLVCCLVQFAVEVLIFETTECLWLNFSVPCFVRDDVTTAAATLTALVNRVAAPSEEGGVDKGKSVRLEQAQQFFLNAPAHMFTSVRLAKALPQLLESMIVGAYTHHLPGEVCKTWPHYKQHLAEQQLTLPETTQHSTAVRSRWLAALARGGTLAMQAFITIPYLYQRVLIRFVQPVLLSGISVVWFIAVKSVVSAIVVGSLCAAVVVYLVRRWRLSQQQQLQSRGRIVPEGAVELQVETFLEYRSDDDPHCDSGTETSSVQGEALAEARKVELTAHTAETGDLPPTAERKVTNGLRGEAALEGEDKGEHSAPSSDYDIEEDVPLHLPLPDRGGRHSRVAGATAGELSTSRSRADSRSSEGSADSLDSVAVSTPSQWSTDDYFAPTPRRVGAAEAKPQQGDDGDSASYNESMFELPEDALQIVTAPAAAHGTCSEQSPGDGAQRTVSDRSPGRPVLSSSSSDDVDMSSWSEDL
jgi:hypothetical protein